MTDDKSTLNDLLAEMSVPERRRTDLRWLLRNLAIHNEAHPNFAEAMQHVKSMLRKETNDN